MREKSGLDRLQVWQNPANVGQTSGEVRQTSGNVMHKLDFETPKP